MLKKLIKFIKLTRTHPVGKHTPVLSFFNYLLNHLGYYNQLRQVVWFEGLKFWYQKGDASFSGNLYWGLQEWQESLFLIRLLKKKDIFVDIGANHGHYTLLASGVVGARSIAIEPIPNTFDMLSQNITLNHLNNLVTKYEVGLAERKGELNFSNDKGTMNKIVSDCYENKISIPVLRLDDLNIDANVVKIDVEGFELDVFNGATEFLSNPNLICVICEINWTLREGVTENDVIGNLAQFGFKPYNFDGQNLWELNNVSNKETFNTIFLRNIEECKARLYENRQISIRNIKLNH